MKKRYMLTLTEEKMVRLKKVIKELGLPPSILSKMIDDNLDQTTEFFEELRDRVKAGEQLTFSDVLGIVYGTMAKAVSAVAEEERKIKA
jgi:hypothetical protein